MTVKPAIPASQIVSVVPSVLPAGGAALDLIGLILTQNTRVPIGEVLDFPSAQAVSSFFGATAQESALASIYFLGFDGSSVKPGQLLFSQYNIAPVSAWLRGGNISALSLSALQAISGTLSITIDGILKSGSINLSAATSFSSAAQIIADTLDIPAVPEVAVVTGSISATTLTVTAVQSGAISIGTVLSGAGITAGTYVSAL